MKGFLLRRCLVISHSVTPGYCVLLLCGQLAAHHRRYLDLEMRRDRYTREMQDMTDELRVKRSALSQNEVTLASLQSKLDDVQAEYKVSDDS